MLALGDPGRASLLEEKARQSLAAARAGGAGAGEGGRLVLRLLEQTLAAGRAG